MRSSASFPSTRSRRTTWLAGGGVLLIGVLALVALSLLLDRANAATGTDRPDNREAQIEIERLNRELERVRGDLAVKDLKLDRLTTVSQYSAAYHIPADVAGQIYDAALAEGIHPSLGYQLVKVESGFQARAKSSAGALGYTQIQLRTARSLDSTVTEQRLLGSETNLRLGFRWLKRLLGQFDHDLELALRAYNLGPTGALTALSDTASEDVGGAYARAVISGLGRAKISGRNR